jgi:hypothetical protein
VEISTQLATWLLSIVELALIIPPVFLIFLSRSKRRRPRLLPGFFKSLVKRPRLALVFIALLVLTIRPALIPILGTVQPRWNDEFSYLLAADTFASGRVTNPTHPMWVHFESFHIIQKPTYMSMYPPAQGLLLGAGERLGSEWLGQLVVTAVMCAAMTWMLQGWLPLPWALFGGLIAVLRLGILSYWLNTYWAASVVALGGILVLGALPRIKRYCRTRDALAISIGLVILANSRPYEGLVFSVPFALAIAVWLVRRDPIRRRAALARVILPILVVVTAAACAMGYYYFRVTGSPFRMTYQVNRGTYATAPYFLWQKPRPEPEYHHPIMRDFYRWELGRFEENRSLGGFLSRSGDKLGSWWRFYLAPILTIPFLALPWVIRDRKMYFATFGLAIFVLGLSVETWTMPHYFAPAAGLLYLLLLQSMRHLRLWMWKGRYVGAELVRLIPVICIAMIVLRLAAVTAHAQIEPAWPRGNWERVRVIARLQREPGKKLVIVSYGPRHTADDEFVYNRADIDAADIVWARDMGCHNNKELINYYRERAIWLLQPDLAAPGLAPYSCGER